MASGRRRHRFLSLRPRLPANQSGLGQCACLNPDLRPNLHQPGRGGDTIVLYGTGEGQTTPAGCVDGQLALKAPYAKPIAPVTVTIGGKLAYGSLRRSGTHR